MAISTRDELFALLEKSKLLSADSLQTARANTVDLSSAEDTAKALIKQGQLTNWQARNLLAGRSVLKLGAHRLLKQLGVGKTGTVFEGECVQTARRVAAKVLSRKLAARGDLIKSFVAKTKRAKAIQHQNLAQVYDLKKEGDLLYLLIELIEGQTLAQLVERNGPLDPKLAAEYAHQTASALAAAANGDLMHGSITPAHLMLAPNGSIKVIGILSEPLLAEPDLDYISPEEAAGKPLKPASDVYSLGCTLYFLLTGQAPFADAPEGEKTRLHKEDLPASMLEKRDDIPPGLVKLCTRMMLKSPATRIKTPADAAAALYEWIQNPDTAAGDVEEDDPDALRLEPVAPNPSGSGVGGGSGINHGEEAGDDDAPEASSNVDDALAQALAMAQFDEELADDDKPGARKKKKKPAYVTDADMGAPADAGLGGGEISSETAEESDDGDEAEGEEEEGQKVFGIDLNKIGLGGPNAKKKQIIAGSVGGGIVALLLIVIYVVPLIFGDGDSPKSKRKPTKKPIVAQQDKTPADDKKPEEEKKDEPTDDPGDEPTDPSDDPTDPTDPVDDGADPTDPADPPVDPTDPPVDPTDPTDPPDGGTPPVDPVDPVDIPNPLVGLGTAVSLPDPASSDPGVIASVELPAETVVTATLLGGDVVSPGLVFDLESGVANAWAVTATKDGKKLVVGHLALTDGDLMFQWDTQFSSHDIIKRLANCFLQLKTEAGAVHTLALRQAARATPILVTFVRDEMTYAQEWGLATEPSLLHVEVTGLDKVFPDAEFKPEASFQAAGGGTTVHVVDREGSLFDIHLTGAADENELQLAIRFTFDLSRTYAGGRSTAEPATDLPFYNGAGPVFVKRINEGLAERKAALQKINELLADSPRAMKTEREKKKAEIEEDIAGIEADVKKFERLAKVAVAIHEKGQIYFRVYQEIGEHTNDILLGGDPAEIDPRQR
jgi:hypothetical protein